MPTIRQNPSVFTNRSKWRKETHNAGNKIISSFQAVRSIAVCWHVPSDQCYHGNTQTKPSSYWLPIVQSVWRGERGKMGGKHPPLWEWMEDDDVKVNSYSRYIWANGVGLVLVLVLVSWLLQVYFPQNTALMVADGRLWCESIQLQQI